MVSRVNIAKGSSEEVMSVVAAREWNAAGATTHPQTRVMCSRTNAICTVAVPAFKQHLRQDHPDRQRERKQVMSYVIIT